MKRYGLFGSLLATSLAAGFASAENGAGSASVNILLITADDLGYEAVGCLNENLPDLTPNLDRFARNGLSFLHGHSNTPICMPSRSTIASGRYGNSSGMMGFMHLKKEIPTSMQLFRDAGYLTGILGKVNHSTPDMQFEWDFVQDYRELGAGRSPSLYYQYCQEFFRQAEKEGKPFYFMVNSHDPHRPFHDPNGRVLKNAEEPSRLFSPDEVVVQKNLPNLPGVREELSHYYNSVRRLDDTFGKVMEALEESGLRDNTLILFLSDNGAAVPFSKANCYLASTRTPWFMQWPGVIESGGEDSEHFVSTVDFLPTALDAAGLETPDGLDGKSFVPLLKGETQGGRDVVFKQIDYLIGGPAFPMRSVQDERYGYIFNSWSPPPKDYRNNNEGLCMKAMEAAAKDDPAMAQRVKMWRQRVVEELYDLEKDPGALNNLADNPEFNKVADRLRARLRDWMVETDDIVLEMFDDRDSSKKMRAYLENEYPTKTSLMPQEQLDEIAAKRRRRK